MTLSLPPLAFLGAGSMGGAILTGLAARGIDPQSPIVATNRSAQKAESLADLAGVTSCALENDPEANRAAAANARVVVLGVKPAMLPETLREIAPALRPETVVVSMAAGVMLTTIEDIVGRQTRVVRVMPNTPAIVGQAVTGLVRGTSATDDDVAAVRAVFEAVGRVIEIPEDRIDALSAISGSGPAYVFYLVEQFTRVAIELGFSDDDARSLVEGTFIGSAALLDHTGEDPAELRRRVTSPKGTTERAIAVFEKSDLSGIFHEAAEAAILRAQEMSQGR